MAGPQNENQQADGPKRATLNHPHSDLRRLDGSPVKKKHAKKASLKPKYHTSIMSGVFQMFSLIQIHPVPQRSQELMGLTYAKHFAESPFAYHGAPSGTTSRLRSWCWKPQIGWVFRFLRFSGCNKIFNDKNLVTKNMNMTNMTVMTHKKPVLLDLVVISYDFRSFLVYPLLQIRVEFSKSESIAFRPVRSNAVSLH